VAAFVHLITHSSTETWLTASAVHGTENKTISTQENSSPDLHMVQQSSRCRYKNIHTSAQFLRFLLSVRATHYETKRVRMILKQLLENAKCLHWQLTSWRYNNSTSAWTIQYTYVINKHTLFSKWLWLCISYSKTLQTKQELKWTCNQQKKLLYLS